MNIYHRQCATLLLLTLPGCSPGTELTTNVVLPENPDSVEPANPQADPMRLAVEESDIEALDALYEEGNAVDTLDTDGFTLLHHAVIAQSPSSVKWLLDHGANPDGSPSLEQPPLPFAVELAKDIPYESAATSNPFTIIHLLIKSGADPLENRNGHLSAVQRAMDILCESCITLISRASLSRAAEIATFRGID